jgi:hypothetical protein
MKFLHLVHSAICYACCEGETRPDYMNSTLKVRITVSKLHIMLNFSCSESPGGQRKDLVQQNSVFFSGVVATVYSHIC